MQIRPQMAQVKPHIAAAGRVLQPRLEKPGYVELVFAIVLIWGFGDAVSSLLAAELAGHHLEANPWIRLLLGEAPLLAIALKLAVALYVGVVLLECRSFVEQVPLWRAWLFSLAFLGAVIVLNNVIIGLHAVAIAI
jgi:hypothetical protein